MRNPDLMYDVIVTDESNKLEEGGENATVEQAQKEVFSDVQAGRYVHGIFICPFGTMDKNTDIKLEVRNREEGRTHCRLYYNLKGNWTLLGYVDIDVSGLIKNWKHVEGRFFRYLKEKRDEDRKYIEYWSKKDFYVEYMVKKYEKMELMNREGILRPRELDYAGVVYNVLETVKGLVKLMTLQQLRLSVNSYVEFEFKKQKIPVTTFGTRLATDRVVSILTLMKTKSDLENRREVINNKFVHNKISQGEHKKAWDEIQGHIQTLQGLIDLQEAEMKRYRDVNEKYNKELS